MEEFIILKRVNKKDYNKINKECKEALKKSTKLAKEVTDMMSKLEPGARFFFLNSYLGYILDSSKLPLFIVISILDGLKQFILKSEFSNLPIDLSEVKNLMIKENSKRDYVG